LNEIQEFTRAIMHARLRRLVRTNDPVSSLFKSRINFPVRQERQSR